MEELSVGEAHALFEKQTQEMFGLTRLEFLAAHKEGLLTFTDPGTVDILALLPYGTC